MDKDSGRRSVLIVEDEGLIALDLRNRLQRAGYDVCAIADDAESALAGAEGFRPSIVLMDIRLSGGADGVAAADRIRKQFHIPVIFVTAHADPENPPARAPCRAVRLHRKALSQHRLLRSDRDRDMEAPHGAETSGKGSVALRNPGQRR